MGVGEVAGDAPPSSQPTTTVAIRASAAEVAANRAALRFTARFNQAAYRLSRRRFRLSKLFVHSPNTVCVESRWLPTQPVADVALGAHVHFGRTTEGLHRGRPDQQQHRLHGDVEAAGLCQPTAGAACLGPGLTQVIAVSPVDGDRVLADPDLGVELMLEVDREDPSWADRHVVDVTSIRIDIKGTNNEPSSRQAVEFVADSLFFFGGSVLGAFGATAQSLRGTEQ